MRMEDYAVIARSHSQTLLGPGPWRIRCALSWTLVGALIVGGCRESLSSSSRVTDGRSLGDLIDRVVPTVVLFYSPTDCFSCITPISEWREVARSGKLRVLLVLDRTPTDDDVRALALQRITVDAIYRRSLLHRGAPTPRELLFDTAGTILSLPQDPRKGVTSAFLNAFRVIRTSGQSDFAPYIQ